MSTQRQGLGIVAVISIIVAPVILFSLLLLVFRPDPGAGVVLTVLIVWSLICWPLIPAISKRLARKSLPLVDSQTYANELSEVTRSRREIVQAFEIERRRIERDLHDGAQQYIVAASMQVGEASMLLDQARQSADGAVISDDRSHQLAQAAVLLNRAQDTTDQALTELRRTVAGIHPKVLSDMGLEEAVRDIASRSGLNVTVRVPHPLPKLPEGVVAAAYFLVSESLTNVAKYAGNVPVTVLLAADQDLHVSIVDMGPGGAVMKPGHGLSGMKERLLAFGGDLRVSSPPGGPTSVSTNLPLLLFKGEPTIVINEENR